MKKLAYLCTIMGLSVGLDLMLVEKNRLEFFVAFLFYAALTIGLKQSKTIMDVHRYVFFNCWITVYYVAYYLLKTFTEINLLDWEWRTTVQIMAPFVLITIYQEVKRRHKKAHNKAS